MNTTSGRIRRLLAAFFLVSLTLLGTAGISAPAQAAPYGTTISITITFTTNAQGQEVVTITITKGGKTRVYKIIIHSVAQTLGTIATDANGNASGGFAVPAGFSGSHSIEVLDTVTGVSTSTSVALPMSGGSTSGGSTSTGGSGSGGLPNTGAAVIGLGALAITFLAAGGGLLVAGRRRGRAHQAA
jgi:hypothetical protein